MADLDCADVGAPVYVGAYDPHRLDADKDGIGCEAAPIRVAPSWTPTPAEVANAQAAAIELVYGVFGVDLSLKHVGIDYSGAEHACFEVGAINIGDNERSPHVTDFSMTGPSGAKREWAPFIAVDDPELSSEDYFGRIAPKTGASTVLCIPTGGERGRFRVAYDSVIGVDRSWEIEI